MFVSRFQGGGRGVPKSTVAWNSASILGQQQAQNWAISNYFEKLHFYLSQLGNVKNYQKPIQNYLLENPPENLAGTWEITWTCTR
jgi:hypothetical protein